MKTTIIYPIRYRYNSNKEQYLEGDNSFAKYDPSPVYYPASHIISGEVEEDDDTEVLFIQTCSDSRETDRFVSEAKQEITEKLGYLGDLLKIKTVKVPFAYSKEGLSKVYQAIRDNIAPNSKIIADLTFGAKYMPSILFCVLNYAEKYLNCEIKKIVYGFYEGDKSIPSYIVDFTTLYLLNTFGVMFDGSKATFDSFADKILK